MAKKKWTKAEREEHSARIKAALSRRRSSVAPVPGELLALGDGRDAVGLDFGKLELRAGARFAEDALRASSVEQLLDALVEHGGTLAAVARAQRLVIRKGQDYNKADGTRDGYFPFGLASYAQMVHVKAQRLNSLALKAMAGEAINFEGVEDTCLDVINYASFLVERMARGDLT